MDGSEDRISRTRNSAKVNTAEQWKAGSAPAFKERGGVGWGSRRQRCEASKLSSNIHNKESLHDRYQTWRAGVRESRSEMKTVRYACFLNSRQSKIHANWTEMSLWEKVRRQDLSLIKLLPYYHSENMELLFWDLKMTYANSGAPMQWGICPSLAIVRTDSPEILCSTCSIEPEG